MITIDNEIEFFIFGRFFRNKFIVKENKTKMVSTISGTRSDNSNAISVGTGIVISPPPKTGYTDSHADRMASIANAEINTKTNDTILIISNMLLSKHECSHEKLKYNRISFLLYG